MNTNLSKQFTAEVDGRTVKFEAVYDPTAHFFTISEDGVRHYKLLFNMETKVWSTTDGPDSSLPVSDLAKLVQQSFGIFV